MGDGMDPATDVGPLINREAFDKVAAHVSDALTAGATRVVGHDPIRPENDWGCFYPPTVLSGVRPEMLVCREETFGPVAPIITYSDEDSIVDRANDTNYGLAAYVYTRDLSKAFSIAERLNFGIIGINDINPTSVAAPFGGMKDSGIGREGATEGIEEYLEVKSCGFSV